MANLEQTNQELQHKANSLIRINRAHEQMHQWESLYTQGRIYDAAESLREIESTVNEDVRGNKFIFEWLAGEFWHRELGWCT